MTLSKLTTRTTPALALAALLCAAGCGKSHNGNTAASQQPQNQPAQQPQNQPAQQAVNPEAAPTPQQASTMPPPPPEENRPPAPTDIPAGTRITIRLGETLSTRTTQPGERFSATVVVPVVVHGRTLIRAGSSASGTVVDSKSAGHFKGQGELVIRLDTIRAEGRTYAVATSTIDRVEQGKGKRTAVITGGGTGLGALIGGLAGGGKGALIGALSGAGAGAAGSAFTGNHEIEIPVETRLTFRLEHRVPLQ